MVLKDRRSDKVLTLTTTITKTLRERVRCVDNYSVVQSALDFNAFAIKNIRDMLKSNDYSEE